MDPNGEADQIVVVVSGIGGRIKGLDLEEYWQKCCGCDGENDDVEKKQVSNITPNSECYSAENLYQLVATVIIEAILDAGINPLSLRNTSVGLVIASATLNNEIKQLLHKLQTTLGLSGPIKLLANTDPANPPLQPILEAISLLDSQPDCETVLVIGISLQQGSVDVITLLIQKNYIAKRCQLKLQQVDFIPENVTSGLTYIETSATTTTTGLQPDNDALIEEVTSISGVLYAKRTCKEVIPFISVPDGNLSKYVQGVWSIVKMVLCVQQKKLIGNVWLYKIAGKWPHMKLLTESKRLQPAAAGSSLGYSFGLTYSYPDDRFTKMLIIAKCEDSKNQSPSISGILQLPSLVPISSYSNEQVEGVLKKIQMSDRNPAYETLLRGITEIPIPSHAYRGYLLSPASSIAGESSILHVQEKPCTKRPLWFVFSGMGTLWPGMMNGLMDLQVFSESIRKATEIMKPYGIDLYQILMYGDEALLDRYMGVCFIAVGIALTDLMIALELTPNGYLGHSGGEILCAYLDGCISQAEALICYYYKDELALKCQNGAMASVRLSWDKAKAKCPPWIYPACHNSANNVTISGLEKDVTKFLAQLANENISSSLVNTNGVAYHTRYLKPMWPEFETITRKIVTNTKRKSDKWKSTSIPEKEWNKSPYNGMADYLLHNMKSPVIFYPVLKFIPKDAVVVEISANSFICSSLEKSLARTTTVLGLIRKDCGNNVIQFLQAVGKLYCFGMDVRISNIYPKISIESSNVSSLGTLLEGVYKVEDFWVG